MGNVLVHTTMSLDGACFARMAGSDFRPSSCSVRSHAV